MCDFIPFFSYWKHNNGEIVEYVLRNGNTVSEAFTSFMKTYK